MTQTSDMGQSSWLASDHPQNVPHLLHRDHPSVQLGSVQVVDTLGRLIRCRHGDKPVTPSPRTAGIGHHLGPDNLQEEGHSFSLVQITTLLVRTLSNSAQLGAEITKP
jgi:hypothetical protein